MTYPCKSCGNTTFTIMDSDWNKQDGPGYRVSCNECHMDYWISEVEAHVARMNWYSEVRSSASKVKDE